MSIGIIRRRDIGYSYLDSNLSGSKQQYDVPGHRPIEECPFPNILCMLGVGDGLTESEEEERMLLIVEWLETCCNDEDIVLHHKLIYHENEPNINRYYTFPCAIYFRNPEDANMCKLKFGLEYPMYLKRMALKNGIK